VNETGSAVSGGLAGFQRALQEAERVAFTEQSVRRVRQEVDDLVSQIDKARNATYEGADEARLVVARVTADGELLDVHLTPHAIRDLDAAALGLACVAAVVSARLRAGTAIAECVAETIAGAGNGGRPAGCEPSPPTYDPAGALQAVREAARRMR